MEKLVARTTVSAKPGADKPARRRVPAALAALGQALPSDVEDRVKAVACHLFASRGIDGVTIREILEAARIRNFGAVGYYFGSKENLVRRILIDGVAAIDARRGELLDQLEATGDAITIEQVIDVLVHAIVDLPALEHRNFIRFVLMVSMTHNDVYVSTMVEARPVHFARCLAHLRRLMPVMSSAAANQRLMFMRSGMGAVLTRRERALATRGRHAAEWRDGMMLRRYVRSVATMLTAPVAGDDAD